MSYETIPFICVSSFFLFFFLHSILGSLKLVFILLGVLGVASIIYFWTTRRSGAGSEQVQRRLANENNLLNQSDINVRSILVSSRTTKRCTLILITMNSNLSLFQMLSVQNLPRCAGMERLGIPTSTIGQPSHSQRDERLINLQFNLIFRTIINMLICQFSVEVFGQHFQYQYNMIS